MTAGAGAGDFESLSWHDDTVYGLRLEIGDPERGDWRSNLVLDIDHIVEWVCESGGTCRCKVAPATLTFHDRERIVDQKICFDRPYYRWRIALNWPQGGEIRFGASDFTLELRAEPVLQDQQQLSPLDRDLA